MDAQAGVPLGLVGKSEMEGETRTSEIESEELGVSEHGQRGRGQEIEGEAVDKRVFQLRMRKGRRYERPAKIINGEKGTKSALAR